MSAADLEESVARYRIATVGAVPTIVAQRKDAVETFALESDKLEQEEGDGTTR